MKKLLLVLFMFVISAAFFGSCVIFRRPPSGDSYFVHAEGSDRNDGLSEETPFRSLFKAMAMAVSTPIKTITVMGTLNAESEQSTNRERVFLVQGMSSEPVLIRGKSSADDPALLSGAGSGRRVILVRGTVPIRFENIEISGGISSMEGGGISLGPGSTVTLGPGAVVRDNQSNTIGGGIMISSGGTLIVDGGNILENRSASVGGGIGAMGQNSSLIILDGIISRNHAVGGGGVAMYQRSNSVFSRGSIHDNTAEMTGGGIMLNHEAVFILEGGQINNNRAGNSGGGIVLLDRSDFSLRSGNISGNQAGEHGGGIASDESGIISIQGGYIGSNQAAIRGGGVFSSGVFVKSGGTIYGSDVPEDTANSAAEGSAVFIYRNDGFFRIREISAGSDMVLDTAADDGWTISSPAASIDQSADQSADQSDIYYPDSITDEWDLESAETEGQEELYSEP